VRLNGAGVAPGTEPLRRVAVGPCPSPGGCRLPSGASAAVSPAAETKRKGPFIAPEEGNDRG